jgi:hypothetical protein
MPTTGRKPFTATDAVAFGLPSGRFGPPAGLSERERKAFMDLMIGCPANHFAICDTPLLVAWAVTTVLAERAAEGLRGEPLATGATVSTWVKVHTEAVKTLGMLAVRLRVSPQGRNPTARASKRSVAPLSFYDQQELSESDNDGERS